MAITALPTAPQRTDSPDVFATRADAWVAALDLFTTETNALQTDVNNKQTLAAASEAAAELAETNAETAQAASEAARDLANNWATKTDGVVSGSEYSAKEYSIGTIVPDGSSKKWANQTGSTVDGSEYSAKEHASGSFVPSGSAKEWAITPENTEVISGEYSAKHWAAKAAASVAVLPEGTINDLLTTTDKTWSSSKIASEILEGRIIDITTKTSIYTVLEEDRGSLIKCSGTFNLNFSSAAVLGAGWYCYCQNVSSGNVTIEPYNTETIDDVANVVLEPDNTFIIISDGSNLKCLRPHKAKPHYITTSETWVCPAGVYEIFVELWGGGGSGNNSAASPSNHPHGGQGGGYSCKTIQITPGTSKVITIGLGGAAVLTDETAGNNGGTSSFSSDITCPGGNGGSLSDFFSGTGASPSGGELNIVGEQGFFLTVSTQAALVGGGTYKTPSTMMRYTSSNGIDGNFPGGGGTGCVNGYVSGAGADGLCIIWY